MDYETAPVGVSHMPQFAWELTSDKKNVKQESYELQIAKDAGFTVGYQEGKHDYFPYPQTVKNMNPNLEQNPGW